LGAAPGDRLPLAKSASIFLHGSDVLLRVQHLRRNAYTQACVVKKPALTKIKMKAAHAKARAAAILLGAKLAPGELIFDDSR
jgi:hypothetical protein